MAFGDVRKCPVCPAYWIEDDQMYEDPAVCPQCGTDSGDFINQYARGKSGNLSRELVLNGGFEYFSGVIDDGKSNIFENWINYYVYDPDGYIVEAVSDCYEGGAAVKLSHAYGTLRRRIEQEIIDPLALAGGDFRYSFWTKGDGASGFCRMSLYPVGGQFFELDTQITGTIYTLFQGNVTIDADNDKIIYAFGDLPDAIERACFVDKVSLKKILTD